MKYSAVSTITSVKQWLLGALAMPLSSLIRRILSSSLRVWLLLPAEHPQGGLIVADHSPGGHQVVPHRARPPVLVLAPSEMLQQGEVIVGLVLRLGLRG